MTTEPKPKFYGWTIITMLFISYSATTISTNSLPFFFPELMKEFGWKHAQVVQPASFYFIYIAVFSPIIGFLLTRFSPKLLMLCGMLLSLGCTLSFALMQSYLHLHLIYLVFSMAITMCGLLSCMVIISNWFQKKRGLATGIFLVGSSAGNIIFPQMAAYLTPLYGWRTAAIGIAMLGAAMSFIPWLFIKNTPQEMGQNIDGELKNEKQEVRSVESNANVFSVIQLFKTPVFYLLLFITAAFWFCGFGVLQNLRLYLTDYGFSIKQAANIAGLFSVFSIIGKVSFGYLSDKFDKMNILLLATVGLICGILSLKMVSVNTNFAYLYAVCYGVGYSGAFAMIQLTVAEMYKGEAFKKTLGIVNSFDSIGGFAGVALMGYLRTQDGNYNTAMSVLLSVCVGAFVLAILLRQVRRARLASY
ncbi:MAG: MFS transporter [Cytophagia bacterium]|nr:MAG: MFS transporter [Cytophagales bacterium]TAG34383.1 MAG: MFS transporter [Cytophagia bacterium]TAG76618.1 MAG: MFS transporter [Cytophagales bacterium]